MDRTPHPRKNAHILESVEASAGQTPNAKATYTDGEFDGFQKVDDLDEDQSDECSDVESACEQQSLQSEEDLSCEQLSDDLSEESDGEQSDSCAQKSYVHFSPNRSPKKRIKTDKTARVSASSLENIFGSQMSEANCEPHGNYETQIEKKNRIVTEVVVRNMCLFFAKMNTGRRQPTKEEKVCIDAVSMAMVSDEIRDQRLQSAMERVFAVSREQQDRALKKLEVQATSGKPVCAAVLLPRASAKSGRFARLQPALDEIVKYFHEDCPLVEVDKSKPDPYTGRFAFRVAGKLVKLTCRRMVTSGTKQDLVAHLKGSAFYAGLLLKIGRTINDKKLESCVCHCMQMKHVTECACSQCTEFKIMIDCWHQQRKNWHSKKKCSCVGCSSSKKTAYFQCSSSVSAFFDALLCAEVEYPHLLLPHFPADEPAAVPRFRSVTCFSVLTMQ